ncbi:DUF1573 domain-containing protein [Calycomorphotria hydatis]|uniref:DUF1573 domain-containing protein n=1 Tax=Calycomorphotria hydatis TaxID=2528027 RepID=A0A517T818_9PLAN|nr:DUF1573 domain-containing protein [Calycomorphotria hydatis]QDT64513.1 hypothetical protein V22_17480 [Calycomorphotria hydatis]
MNSQTQNTITKSLPVLLPILACVPVLFSFAAQLSASAPRSIAESSGAATRPALAFDEYLVNAGNVRGGGVLAGKFHFTNRGDSPVTISEVAPSCGCLSPVFTEEAIAPGERGDLVLRVDTLAETSGPKEYYADIHYRDPEPRTARVHLKFALDRPEIVIEPRQLLVYQMTDEPTVRTVSIYDFRPEPFEVQSVEVQQSGSTPSANDEAVKNHTDCLMAELVPREEWEEPKPHEVARVRVTVFKKPESNSTPLVRILTDDESKSVLYLPVGISGGTAFPGARRHSEPAAE